MLSFSDVKRYINDSPAVMRFKPWWEISLDLLLAGLFLILLLAWTRSFSVEAGGIICVPIEGDASALGTSDARYIQSRCYMESPIKNIEFYPYIIFLQWCFIFLCQITWIWIPAVVAKLRYFYDIFNEISLIDPNFVFSYTNLGFLPELDYSEDNKAKLKVLHDKITFMLMDKNYLSKVYIRKVYALSLLILACIVITISWILFIEFLQSDFSCDLKGGFARKQMPAVACNISPHMFLYGIMILHVIILALMLMFSIRGLIWHNSIKSRFHSGKDKFFGDFEDNYKGLPGYEDLALMLELFRVNVRDGKLTLSIIMYVLNSKYNNKTQGMVNTTGINIGDEKDTKKYSFWEEWNIINIMLNELGLKIKTYHQHPNRLFDILSDLQKSENTVNLFIEDGIKERIMSEIIEKYEDYTSIIQNINSNYLQQFDANKILEKPYNLDEKIGNINQPDKWPDHIILQAASNILKMQFLLVSVDKPVEGNIFTYDVIKPFTSVGIFKSSILAYVRPYYYYSLVDVSDITIAQSTHQSDFVLRRKYRDRLRVSSARKFASNREEQLNPINNTKKHIKHKSEGTDIINKLYNETVVSRRSTNSAVKLLNRENAREVIFRNNKEKETSVERKLFFEDDTPKEGEGKIIMDYISPESKILPRNHPS